MRIYPYFNGGFHRSLTVKYTDNLFTGEIYCKFTVNLLLFYIPLIMILAPLLDLTALNCGLKKLSSLPFFQYLSE